MNQELQRHVLGTDGNSGSHQWFWQILDQRPSPNPREKKKRYHSGIVVFVSLVYMLSLSKQIWRQRSNSPCADTGFS